MSDINENLIPKVKIDSTKNPQFRKPTFMDRLRCLFNIKSKDKYKIIRFPNQSYPYSNSSNRVDNRKTNVITFLPMLLITEFKQFLNFYFLMLCLSQFYEPLRVGKLKNNFKFKNF